jgi:hypothetical protein
VHYLGVRNGTNLKNSIIMREQFLQIGMPMEWKTPQAIPASPKYSSGDYANNPVPEPGDTVITGIYVNNRAWQNKQVFIKNNI